MLTHGMRITTACPKERLAEAIALMEVAAERTLVVRAARGPRWRRLSLILDGVLSTEKVGKRVVAFRIAHVATARNPYATATAAGIAAAHVAAHATAARIAAACIAAGIAALIPSKGGEQCGTLGCNSSKSIALTHRGD